MLDELERRLTPHDASLITSGLEHGLFRIDGTYVRTVDEHQGTAWLVEDDPVRPCWEYLPHLAAYVELIQRHGFPPSRVRFETPDSEHNLDLAVLDDSGRVVILGEAKARASQLDALITDLVAFTDADPGKPLPVARGGPKGRLRDAWKLAHQLWVLRPAFLWLVAPKDRRTFSVHFGESVTLVKAVKLPVVTTLGIAGGSEGLRIAAPSP